MLSAIDHAPAAVAPAISTAFRAPIIRREDISATIAAVERAQLAGEPDSGQGIINPGQAAHFSPPFTRSERRASAVM